MRARIRAAGPQQGRLREQGKAKARRARLRARAAAPNLQCEKYIGAMAAWNWSPSVSNAAAAAASVGAHQ
jgi:hypothetical protein